jgi:hypothetical protein
LTLTTGNGTLRMRKFKTASKAWNIQTRKVEAHQSHWRAELVYLVLLHVNRPLAVVIISVTYLRSKIQTNPQKPS